MWGTRNKGRTNFDLVLGMMFWLITVIVFLFDFAVYSSHPPSETNGWLGSGTIAGGWRKALDALPIYGSVSCIYTLFVILQRRLESSGKALKPTALSFRGLKWRVPVIILMSFLSFPWIFALFGIYVSDVPLLGHIFLGRGEVEPVVHLGQHHGLDGYVFTSLILIETLASPLFTYRWISRILGIISSVFLWSSIHAFLEDFLCEQVVARGVHIPIIPFKFSFLMVGVYFLLGWFTYRHIWKISPLKS